MPETCLYEEAVKKPTKTYGDKSLIVDFPRGHSYIGAWLSLPVPQTAFLYKFQPTPYIEEDQKDTVSDWPEKKDPFTKEDLLNSEDNQLQQLIFQIIDPGVTISRPQVHNLFAPPCDQGVIDRFFVGINDIGTGTVVSDKIVGQLQQTGHTSPARQRNAFHPV